MRLSEFWERMNSHFGPGYAASVARDQVLAGLGGRTVEQALEGATDTGLVWRAVCEAFEIRGERR